MPLEFKESKQQESIRKVLSATIRAGSAQTAGEKHLHTEAATKYKKLPKDHKPYAQNLASIVLNRRDSHYYAPDQVERTAEVQQLPDLPVLPQDAKQQGHLQLKILINESGLADRIEIEEITPPSAYGEEIAATYMGAKYQAATINSKPVKSWLRIDISYGE